MTSYPALAAGLAGQKPPRPTVGWRLKRAALYLPDLIIWGPRYLWQLRQFRSLGATAPNILVSRPQLMPLRAACGVNALMIKAMRDLDPDDFIAVESMTK